MPPYPATSHRVGIRRPMIADADEFIAMTQASQAFHHPWVDPPKTREAFETYVETRQKPEHDAFLICDLTTHRIAGVINVSNIVRGAFQSAYLGYYAHADFAGKGYMTEGLQLVTRFAFDELKLHRVEANVQPENAASIALARSCGFRKEGFSPKYLQIFGEWRDHERWALLADTSSD